MKINVRDAKVVWFFFQPYKWQCLGVLALMSLSGLLETANLAALYPIINYGLNLQKKDFFLRHFEQWSGQIAPGNPFLAACLLLIAVSVLAIAARFIYNYFSNKLMMQIIGDTQKKMFEQFVRADYGFYVKNQQGNLIYAGTVAPERVTVAILATLTLAYNAVNSLCLFSLLLLLSWHATLLIIGLGLFYGFVIKKIMKTYINRCAQVTLQENQRKNVILNEFISGIKTIKVFLSQDHWKSRYVQCVDSAISHQLGILVAKNFPEMLVKFLFYVFIAAVGIYYSHRSAQDIVVLLPVLGTFVLVVNRFLPSIYVIGSAVMSIGECLPGMTVVHNFCQEKFSNMQEGSQQLNGFQDRISFEDVWFKYVSTPEPLLKGVSFTLEKNKMTAIVGPSGSGKTTLINLLLKLYSPEKGAIKFDGIDIGQISTKSYLNMVGYVSQEAFVFNSSIKENIRFGMPDCTQEMIEEAAKLANAHDFIMETSHGYETVVGDAGIKLSGGQRQRVAIARAMLRKPQIVVLDEATSSLDNISENKIQKAINNISKHTTVLVIAHRLSTVRNADKIIILEKGEIKEQGTHEELLRNKKTYYELHMSKQTVPGDLNES